LQNLLYKAGYPALLNNLLFREISLQN
jgi:hypothetical protein